MTLHLSKFGKGRPLVFFHGWGFDSQVWYPLIPELENIYEIILVDLPGFGQSPFMEWEHFKIELLTVLPRQFALAGWSMGGLYATRLALEASHRVTHVVNISSSPKFNSDGLWPGVSAELLLNFYQKLSLDKNKTLKEFVGLQLKQVKIPVSPCFQATSKGLEQGLEVLKSWDLRESLQKMKPPTCFIFGKLDPITPATIMNTMQVLYPQFNYTTFKKAAHMPFLSHSQEFIIYLREFLQ